MKKITLFLIFLFVGTTFFFLSCNERTDIYNDATNNTKDLVVLVKYKTQPAKESEALTALKNLIEKVKKEPNYSSIKMLVDPIDKSNILLYEQWSDETYYKGEHMNTPHLQHFMKEARLYLAGPPDISFWKMESF
ncbi:MAG: putative quinol monooxygenase [Ferruginibacter sp.]